jgi:Holliday junction DNA helicase RuvB
MATTQNYRPNKLSDIIGQDEVREYIQIKIASAKQSGKPIGHTLFLGPSGVGKTTFAQALANELGAEYREIFAPTMKDPALLIEILQSIPAGGVIFVDEIHALPSKVQEVLYTALEDGKISGRNARTKQMYTIQFKPFTMIGATTHEGLLNEPLRKRFPNNVRMRPYSIAELSALLTKAAYNQFNLQLAPNIASRIASVAQGTPRVGRNLLQCVVDVALTTGGQITTDIIDRTLKYEELDPVIGLNRQQRRYLMALATEGSMGAKGLATVLDEQLETIEFAIEPFLMQEVSLPNATGGFTTGTLVRRTSKGREITSLGLDYLAMCRHLQGKGWFVGEIYVV